MNLKTLSIPSPETAPDILVYFWIDSLGGLIAVLRRAVNRGDAFAGDVGEDQANAYHDQTQLVEMLTKRHGFASHDEYMQWYRWWGHWHKQELSNEQWKVLDKMLKWDGTQTEETFAEWKPSGTWKREEVVAQASE